MVRHYEGTLGVFDYDDEMFRLLEDDCGHYLCYNYSKDISLPNGILSTRKMFYNCKLPKGFTLGSEFDTSKVTDMSSMFEECKMSEGFSLGDKFITSNVENMKGMFEGCTMPKNFSLGDSFDTSNVQSMWHMFCSCSMSEDFSLGVKFDTSNVKDTRGMFSGCELPKDFSLGDKFDTSNVENMDSMFWVCSMQKGFSLGDKFNTSKVKNMSWMFYNCTLPEGFTLGDKFDTTNVKDMRSMFEDCELPEGFNLGNKFNTSNVKDMHSMFEECKLSEGFMLGDKFDTSSVETTENMFRGVLFPKDADYRGVIRSFDFNSIKNMKGMFEGSTLLSGVPLESVLKHVKTLETTECMKVLMSLLKEGNSLAEARKKMLNNPIFTADIIERAEDNLKNKLNQKCSDAITSLFSVKDAEEECSKYTVGEVCDELLSKGFPKEVVTESIVDYLKDQVLV